MLIFSFIAIPLVPPIMVIGPIVYVFYWICACDEELDDSCHCGDLRPSVQVLYENLFEYGRFRFLCINTRMCSCVEDNAIGSSVVALLIFVLVTIPFFMLILVIALGFCSTFGIV